MKKVVITGCTGMLGMGLIAALLDKEIEVLAIAHPTSPKINRLPQNELLKIVECDISRLSELHGQIDGQYDTFYHFAWKGTFGDSRNDIDQQIDNVQYTVDAVRLAAALGCSTFIGAGSQAEYGRSAETITEHTPTRPENGYGIAKLSAGYMSRIECEKLGLKHIWTRIFSVYGPNDNMNTMINSCIITMLKGEKARFTKAEQLWDYLFVEDAAEAFILIGENGKDKTIYNLGSGKAVPLYEYIYKIRDMIRKELTVGIGEIEYSKHQVMYLCADISLLERDTGFRPRSSFESGIEKTIAWCIKRISDS